MTNENDPRQSDGATTNPTGDDARSPGAAVADTPVTDGAAGETAAPAPRRRATRSRTSKKAAAAPPAGAGADAPVTEPGAVTALADPPTVPATPEEAAPGGVPGEGEPAAEAAPAPVKRARAPRKRAAKKTAAADLETADAVQSVAGVEGGATTSTADAAPAPAADPAPAPAAEAGPAAETAPAPVEPAAADALFDPPAAEPAKKTARKRTRKAPAKAATAEPAAATDPVPAAGAHEPSAPAAPAAANAAPAPGTGVHPGTDAPPATGTVAAAAVPDQTGSATASADTDTPTDTAATVPTTGVTRSGRTRRRAAARAATTVSAAEPAAEGAEAPAGTTSGPAAVEAPAATVAPAEAGSSPEAGSESATAGGPRPVMPLFQAPEPVAPRPRRAASRPAGPPRTPTTDDVTPTGEVVDLEVSVHAESATASAEDLGAQVIDEVEDLVEELTDEVVIDEVGTDDVEDVDDLDDTEDVDEDAEEASAPRRRRRRGGRGRRGRGRTDAESDDDDEAPAAEPVAAAADAGEQPAADAPVDEDDEADEGAGEATGSRRRRRRRRRGAGGEGEAVEEGTRVVTRVRESHRDDVTAIRGSTRLEAKKQRRREGREAGRRRSILSEAEFLTRRESVDRVMVVRERDGRTQIGVLEDKVLVEHYVARKTQTSTVGNVYLGRVQNVLPSMEAAFIDIGKGRNAVLYAGEVNWDAAGLDGQPRRIEHALKAGEAVLVQVTKDPIGHKGARLTSQISMPGRYLVYVPDGSMTGISRKLPDTERSRLKKILREIVPDDAGVIVRTAAEGASDEELERDVARLRAQWEDISAKAKTQSAPTMLYGEPDLAIKVVRDIFNEDFSKLIVSGDEAWETLQGYISHVAPDLAPRLQRWESGGDVFAAHRIDEQLAKGMDRKVWLPSGGSLVIDRTEAMTVVDVNTGKFVGAGGNLEETVTKNNLEAAEEVVHQLRLRDIGGIIVVDFIDMVLESNRDLVLRRLLECLGRDRTRHQVAEVTSLGLVQMTRKRVGQGLLEVFSETCEHCGGRGLVIHDEPVEKRQQENSGNGGGGGGGGGGGRKGRH